MMSGVSEVLHPVVAQVLPVAVFLLWQWWIWQRRADETEVETHLEDDGVPIGSSDAGLGRVDRPARLDVPPVANGSCPGTAGGSALGSVAEFEGQQLTVIGFMTRSDEFEGTRYFWQEYLLYNPAVGFRWLVESDGHWSYVTNVPPGEVTEAGSTARHGGRGFKMYQDAVARVEYVEGEFYWKVEAGEFRAELVFLGFEFGGSP